MKEYENEARERYGNTAAYGEYKEKTKSYINDRWTEAGEGMTAIFADLSKCKNSGKTADSPEAQMLIAKLQAYITENFYTCTDEILCGLGKTYVSDERFKKNIDKAGEGTAEYASRAIEVYCSK